MNACISLCAPCMPMAVRGHWTLFILFYMCHLFWSYIITIGNITQPFLLQHTCTIILLASSYWRFYFGVGFCLNQCFYPNEKLLSYVHDACVQGNEHAPGHVWRPEDSFADVALSALPGSQGLPFGRENACPSMESLMIPSYGQSHLSSCCSLLGTFPRFLPFLNSCSFLFPDITFFSFSLY